MTGKARAAIRRATRQAVRLQYAGLGRRIVERLFQRAKIVFSDEKLIGALSRSRGPRSGCNGGGRTKRAQGVRRRPGDVPDYKEERAAAMAVKAKGREDGLA